MKNVWLYQGDCLEVMDELIKQSVKVDLILTDPPYGTTACKWDSAIPFDEMWERLNKLIKPNGAIVLFGSEPFSSYLRISNIKNFKYDWVWRKSRFSNPLLAKKQPLKITENISVFNSKIYIPQGLIECNKITKQGKKVTDNIGGGTRRSEYKQQYTNYPKNILEYSNVGNNSPEKTVHPTQKPVDLLEYLIKTYTNENEIVLDFTMGSGSTGVACLNTNRKFIGIELDEKYFEIAKNRIENHEVKK